MFEILATSTHSNTPTLNTHTNTGVVSQTRGVATVVEAAPYLQADEVTLMKSTGDMLTTLPFDILVTAREQHTM